MIKIAPSILSSDFTRLGDEIELLQKSECEYIHIDVMDGNYVPNLTIGPMVIKAIRERSTKTFDVHLMVLNPIELVDLYIDAGADMITFHPETTPHLHRGIQYIKSKKVKVGLALNPSTPLNVIEHVISDIDMVLLMTVNPGFGGQSFIPAMNEKIKKLKSMITASGFNIDIEVDGGINADNIEEIVRSGANVIVAGSAVFDARNPIDNIRNLKNLALNAYDKANI